MKRLIALLLAALLTTSFFSTARAASVNTTMFTGEDRPDSVAAEGNTLWVLSGNQLWQWALEEQEPRLLAGSVPNALRGDAGDDALGHLFALSGGLYSFHPGTGTLSAVHTDRGAARLETVRTFDRTAWNDGEGSPRMIKNSLMTEDGIWLLTEDASGNWHELMLLQTADGAVKAFGIKNIISIARYKGNQLLLLLAPDDGGKASIAVFDPASGKKKTAIKSVAASGADGLGYDVGSNTACYAAGGSLYAHPNMGKAREAGYIPAPFVYKNPAMPDGHMAFLLQEGLVIRSLTTNKNTAATVRVYGISWDTFLLSRLRAMLPDIRIEAPEDWKTAVELGQAVVTDTFDYDVAVLSLGNPQLYKLMDKGYLADLRGFPETARVLDRLYPQLLLPVKQGGSVYGLPGSISITTHGYQQKTLDLIGMRPEELPGDILAYLDFIASWQDRPQALDAGVLPALPLDRQSLLEHTVVHYMAQHQVRGLQLSFDTPLFRQMLDKLISLDDAFLSSLAQTGGTTVIKPLYDLRNVQRKRGSPAWIDMDFDPLPLPLQPGMGKVYPFRGDYAVVMRRTKKPEAAARVAAAICEADWTQAMSPVMFRDYQPVLSDNYLENLAAMQQHARHMENEAKKATGAEKTNLLKQLEEHNAHMAAIEQDKYVATDDEVAAYRRDILPYLKPEKPSLVYDINNLDDLTFFNLFRQFIGGAISAEQFISEGDRILRMMEKEGV
ncbi:MAG: hypothetical protein ACOX63_12845 [Christensenellales bacterium]|jgi:hypothetical protein